MALSRFRKKLESLTPFSDTEFLLWANIMHEKHYSKGEVLLQEGQVCKQFYYILNGCIRCFCLMEGKELNVKFCFEDDFACDFDSFRHERPSELYLVAMEDVTVLYSTKSEALPVFESQTSFYIFLFRFFQDHYFKETEHSNSFKLMSPEQRYRHILQYKPHYLQRIPLIHLAPYLGISRETLTRIRKKIA